MEAGQLINLSSETLDDSGIFFVTNSGAKISYGYFIACVMSIILAGWIIALNGIVIHTLLCRKVYQDVTDFFVSSLSIADLVTGIVMLYVTSYSLLQYQNTWECLFRFGLTYTVSHSSFTHILAITVDRYVKVIYPFRYFTIFTKKTVTIISTSIWACSILIGLLPLFGWNQEYINEENRDTVCRFFGVLTNEYFIFNLVISVIPSVGTLCLYVCIIMTAVKKKDELKALTEGVETAQSAFDERTWKLVKTVAIIVVFSNFCWTPGSKYFLQSNSVKSQY